MSLNYFISEAVSSCIMQTVRLVAKDGWRLLGDNRFERPRDSGGTARDRSRLPPAPGPGHLRRTGVTRYPRHHHHHAPESELQRHLQEATAVLAAATLASGESIDDLVSDDFEHLR